MMLTRRKPDPKIDRLLDRIVEKVRAAPPMTAQEIEAQRQSFVRGMTQSCEHGVVDYEQCPECREA